VLSRVPNRFAVNPSSNPGEACEHSGSAEMPTVSSAVDWLQAAAKDAANSSSASSSRSGSAAFPDQVLVSRAAGYAPTPPSTPPALFRSVLSVCARSLAW
jgi:hypothetical protein